MTFAEHLDELRSRLVKGAIVIVVLFLGGWTFLKDQLTALFMYPHQRSVARLMEREPPIEVNEKLILLSPLENLFFTLKASLMVACLKNGTSMFLIRICLRSSTSLNDTLNCTQSGHQIQLFGRHVTRNNITSYTTSQVLQIKVSLCVIYQFYLIIP